MTEFSEKIFKYGFIKDLNKLSNKRVFDQLAVKRTCTPVQVVSEYGYSSNINADINNKLQMCLTSYGFWSDFQKIQNLDNLIRVDLKRPDFSQNYKMLKKNNPGDRLNEIFVYAYDKFLENDVEIDESKLDLSQELVESLKMVDSLTEADAFFDLYGTDFPISSYLFKQHTFFIVKVSSFAITNDEALFELGKFYLEDDSNQKEKKVHGNRFPHPSTDKFEFQLELVGKTPQMLGKTFQPTDTTKVEWLPLWRIVDMNKTKYSIQDSVVKLLEHMWYLREENFYYKEEFCQARIGHIKSGLFRFDLETYWQDSIYQRIKIKYLQWYSNIQQSGERVNDLRLKKFIVECYQRILSGIWLDSLCIFLYSDLAYLSSTSNFDQFVNEKTDQGSNVFVLCYSSELIESSPATWKNILTMFVEKFAKSDNNQAGEKTIGLLVDYDLHQYLSNTDTFKDFYKKFFCVCNLYSDRFLDLNVNYKKWCDVIEKEFLEIVGVNLKVAHLNSNKTSHLAASPRTHLLKNLTELSEFFQNLYKQPNYKSIREFFHKKEKKLRLVVESLKKDNTSNVFNHQTHQTDERFVDLVAKFGLTGAYYPVRLDQDDVCNSFYKSVSLVLYGTCELWLLIKLGVVFIIYSNETHFRDLIREREEDFFNYEHMFVQACRPQSFVNCYTQVAVFLLFNRPVVCYNLILNSAKQETINCVNFELEGQYIYEHKIYLLFEKSTEHDRDFYRFCPLLPASEETALIQNDS